MNNKHTLFNHEIDNVNKIKTLSIYTFCIGGIFSSLISLIFFTPDNIQQLLILQNINIFVSLMIILSLKFYGYKIWIAIFSILFFSIMNIGIWMFLSYVSGIAIVYTITLIILIIFIFDDYIRLIILTMASVLFTILMVVDIFIRKEVMLSNSLGIYAVSLGLIIMIFVHKKALEIFSDRLDSISRIDFLTSARNRKAYEEDMRKNLALYNRKKDNFSLVYIDINNFKTINDSYGHEIGDQVLKIFSKWFFQQIRISDFFYRIGGDEFVIIFMNSCLKECNEKINEISHRFEDTKLFPVNVSFSYGISSMVEAINENENIDIIADHRMYHAKNKFKISEEVEKNYCGIFISLAQ